MKKIIEKKKPEIHRGFVSLEIMGALVVVAMAALLGAEKYSDYLDEQEWMVAARHASQFNEASKQYIADHRDELLNQPLPYRITPSLLIKNGYLQQGFSEKNGLGQQYVTGVVKNSAKAQPALQALTCSVQGAHLSEKGMRRIATQITGMGGMSMRKILLPALMADGQASQGILALTAAMGILPWRYRLKSWGACCRKAIGCTDFRLSTGRN